jgi:hypothetical protein
MFNFDKMTREELSTVYALLEGFKRSAPEEYAGFVDGALIRNSLHTDAHKLYCAQLYGPAWYPSEKELADWTIACVKAFNALN